MNFTILQMYVHVSHQRYMRHLLVAPVAAAAVFAVLSLTVVSMTLLPMTLCDVIVRLEVDSLM